MVGWVGLQGIDEVSARGVNQGGGGGKRMREGNPADGGMYSKAPRREGVEGSCGSQETFADLHLSGQMLKASLLIMLSAWPAPP